MDRGIIERIREKVLEMREEIIYFEQELVKIPSPNPPGDYQAISKAVADKLKTIGFEISVVGRTPEKANVVGKLNGTIGKPVLIHCAHLDTVPPGVGWTVDPYGAAIKMGKIFGRGAYDAKARIVVYIMAAKAIQETGFHLKGNLIGYYTADEETGGVDGAAYLAQAGHLKGDVAICEGRQDEIWFAESGHVTLRIDVYGEAAHAMYPSLGISAIDKMTDLLAELSKLRRDLKRKKSKIPGLTCSTINVGTIRGGQKANMLADQCSIDVDVRIIPESDVDEIMERIGGILNKLKKGDPQFRADLQVLMRAEPSMSPRNLPIIKSIQKIGGAIMGAEPQPVGLHADSDGKYFRKAGTEAIHWGVGTAKNRGHAADEFIEIEDLLNLTSAHALVAMDFLGFEK